MWTRLIVLSVVLGFGLAQSAAAQTTTEIIDATGDGTSPLTGPQGILVDGSGIVYVAGWASDNAFQITPGGVITELIDGTGDGMGNTLDSPTTIAVDGSGNVYVAGTSTDNVFKIALQWTDLSGGTTGIAGQPTLVGSGTLVGGTPTSLTLTNAPTSAAMLAWVSFAPTPFMALGGTVHAFPFANQLFAFADMNGDFSASTTWPAGIPPDTNVWFQFIVQDLSVPEGLTLSNGLLATTP
jgi:hypothetical protein